jgi:large subunit ribosomal protein L22
MKVSATAKYVGTSARKTGLVAALIRGRSAEQAIIVLNHTNKRATDPIGKVLMSAIANAENNYNLRSKDLMVESVLIGPGPTLKRFRARAKGSASSIRKRSSHITVVLSDDAAKAALAQPAKVEKPKAEAKPEVKASKEVTAKPAAKEAK